MLFEEREKRNAAAPFTTRSLARARRATRACALNEAISKLGREGTGNQQVQNEQVAVMVPPAPFSPVAWHPSRRRHHRHLGGPTVQTPQHRERRAVRYILSCPRRKPRRAVIESPCRQRKKRGRGMSCQSLPPTPPCRCFKVRAVAEGVVEFAACGAACCAFHCV